jgi:hypothetical protein
MMKREMQRQRPGQPDDLRLVVEAAGCLGVEEFELFRLAWRHWRGEDAATQPLEKAFAGYMFQQTAPAWVRHFCREVLAREQAGRLDPAAFGVARGTARGPEATYARLSVAVIAAVGLIVIPAVLQVSYQPRSSTPLVCEMGPGIRFYAGIAHAFAERAPPACLRP